MGHSNGIITAPISVLGDVASVLGESSGDVATLCSSAQINRFAKYKPIRFNRIDDLTDANRTSAGQGLALSYLAADATAAQALLNTQQSSIPALSIWGYNRVRPGTDWSRLTDFLNPGGINGYNHSARAPLNGFGDVTIFDDEFGSETKTWTFNFKWGPSSYQGNGTQTGIEIPVTELMSEITDGTWRLALLIFFPQSGGKYLVAAASSPGAIPSSSTPTTTEIGNMMIRPTGTGQLSSLMRAAYNAGTKTLTAIPVLAKGLSRGGSGAADKWSATGSAQFISMPKGEKVTVRLSAAVENVSVSFNSIIIKYIGGSSSPTYTLYPVGGSGLNKTQLGKPSSTLSTSCQITLDFTLSCTGKSQQLAKSNFNAGIGLTLSNGSVTKLEQYTGGAWKEVSAMQMPPSAGRYRITVLDKAVTSSAEKTPIMTYIENLPRRAPAQDVVVTPCISILGVTYACDNFFYHEG